MTAREIFDSLLVELNKVNAPSLLLEDFNYLFNKAINQYVNKRYNIYDVNQQTTDDLRVLKASCKLQPKESRFRNNSINPLDDLFNGIYEVTLPDDYLHMLNCICIFRVKQRYKCYNLGTHFNIGATRLTSDAWSKIITDYYNRPSYRKPYYYINNVNTSESEPYDPVTYNNDGEFTNGTDQLEYDFTGWKVNVYINDVKQNTNFTFEQLRLQFYNNTLAFNPINDCKKFFESNTQFQTLLGKYNLIDHDKETNFYYLDLNNQHLVFIKNSNNIDIKLNYTPTGEDTDLIKELYYNNLPRAVTLSNKSSADLIYKPAGLRHSNASKVICEIRCGKDRSVFELESVIIDYLKSPQHIRLTQEELDSDLDISQVMEYPDYVCQEIINELVTIVMENSSDARLQNHLSVSQSIASPTQQQAQPQNS